MKQGFHIIGKSFLHKKQKANKLALGNQVRELVLRLVEDIEEERD